MTEAPLRYKPYPSYKPSGVAWLGDVPAHWAKLSLARFARCYAGGTPDRNNDSFWEDGTIPWINSGAVNQQLITEPSAFITEEAYNNSSARWVEKGDLVMALAGQGKTKGLVAQLAIRTTCNQSMAAISTDKRADRRFVYWLLSAQYEQIRNMAGGEQRDGLNLEILGQIPCLLPPLSEQGAIAAFLDRETGRIDELVAKKRELIERLQEKRTALISHAVTRGLDPNAKLKPSGLPWLGDIPAHWDVKPLKLVARIGNGSTPNREDAAYWEEGTFPWLNSAVVNQQQVAGAEEFVTTNALRECHLPIVKPPAVLVGITGQGKTRGMATLLLVEATINQHLAYLSPLPRTMDVQFLLRLCQTSYSYLRSESDGAGSTKGAITCEQLGNLQVPVPPLAEQCSVAACLEKSTSHLDALARKAEEAIERLQEYRTALITAAVTGKIDVRRFQVHASKLPEN